MGVLIIVVILLVVVVLYFVIVYNSMVTAKVRISEAFSQIDVQLKRRADLIPNLVETVKGYASHEKTVFEEVTKARASLMSAGTAPEKAAANNVLSASLKSLFAVAENYPDLKASQNFLELQEELSDTENKIAYSRQFYNTNVMDYNTMIQTFPSRSVANMFHFAPAEFFEAADADRQPVKVSF